MAGYRRKTGKADGAAAQGQTLHHDGLSPGRGCGLRYSVAITQMIVAEVLQTPAAHPLIMYDFRRSPAASGGPRGLLPEGAIGARSRPLIMYDSMN